nr:hypothetical protein [Tanacetum cinerariifolium]
SFPRPPEELNAEIADTIIESIPLLHIPVPDGNSQQEEIDIVTKTDDVLPPSDENDDDSSDDSLLEEVDLFLSDNSIPSGIENFADDPEGDICFLEGLLINDFILSHESSDSNFEDSPLILRPPPEPPNDNFDLEPEVISVVMEDIDEPDEHFNPGGEIFFLQTLKMLITFLSCLSFEFSCHISSFLRFLLYYSPLRVRIRSLILESLENSSNEIAASNSDQEKEEPSQDSNIRKLIREVCSIEVCEEQKQSMEDTMLELVKIFQEKEFICIHDNVDDLIESALNSKLISINSNSQHLDNEKQEVKNVVEQPVERGNCSIQSLQNFRVVHKKSISLNNTSQISSIHAVTPILSTREPEHSLSMGYEHLSITPETESDEVTESNVENLLPIPSECEVTLEDKSKCDVPISENSLICDDHSDIFSDSKIDDDILVYNDDFEDIEYVEASLSDLEIDSVEEENVVQQEEEEVDLEDISQIQDVVLREKLLSINRLIANIESLNKNSTPDCVLNSFKFDNSLLDKFSPEFETFAIIRKRQEVVTLLMLITLFPNMIHFALRLNPIRRGDIRFLEELLIDDSILSHESSDSHFEDNLSIPRPPPEPPDAEIDTGEEIPVVMNDKDKFDEDYHFSCLIRCYLFSPPRVRIPSLTLGSSRAHDSVIKNKQMLRGSSTHAYLCFLSIFFSC